MSIQIDGVEARCVTGGCVGCPLMPLDSSTDSDAPKQWAAVVGVGTALAAFLVALLAPGVGTGVTIAVGAVLVAVLAINLAARRAGA